ncbi:hypothetical protein J2Z48_001285 [Croceifilum oryzae]|uniref:Uncharacterized protein n=1 Tax=Croceifilum oryzae TaxID=1553429 RepID=A0AAJ1WS91_9BACL|nr:hypothetical protein [Croceifilum oryzae]MDQ0417113.1 hypothetical protein [Croceifilum oryzae]
MKNKCKNVWLKSGVLMVSGMLAIAGFNVTPHASAAPVAEKKVVNKEILSVGSGKHMQYTIAEFKRDVTGDKVKDVITLIGQKEFMQDGWNEKLYLRVVDGKSHKKVKVEVGNGGYEPSVKFKDFNGDHITDIQIRLFSGATGHSPIENYYYTVGKGSLSEIKN